jgi:hypothetical protein
MGAMKRLVEDMVYVQVFLNQTEDGWNFWHGYRPGDKMLLAAEYYRHVSLLPDPLEGHPDPGGLPSRILNEAWRELNIDEPAAEWAKEYRAKGNRSLSVGDVVVVGECAYAVAKIGWQAVSLSREDCIYETP